MIRVDVTRRRGVADLVPKREIEAIVVAAATAAGAPVDATVAVILSDDAELAGLNATHMGKDGPTDVLSFPLLPPAAFPAHAGQDPAVARRPPADVAFALPPGEPVHLGDIVVSVERAVEQAARGVAARPATCAGPRPTSCACSSCTGRLHLCGWDHAEPAEEAAMRALERELLGCLSGPSARQLTPLDGRLADGAGQWQGQPERRPAQRTRSPSARRRGAGRAAARWRARARRHLDDRRRVARGERLEDALELTGGMPGPSSTRPRPFDARGRREPERHAPVRGRVLDGVVDQDEDASDRAGRASARTTVSSARGS